MRRLLPAWRRRHGGDDLRCVEVVELVTAFLDGALPPDVHDAFERHLAQCDGCATYVEQIRTTIAAAGSVSVDTLTPETKAGLLDAFRDFPA